MATRPETFPRRRGPMVANSADDPTIEFVEVNFSGITYKLCWDFNSLAIAEKEAGINLLDGIFQGLTSGASCNQLRGLLYAALLKAHPKMTIEEAGKLVRIDRLALIVKALGDAYQASIPENERGNPTGGQAGAAEESLPKN